MTAKQALEELKFQVGNITYFTKDLQATTRKVRDSGLFEIIDQALTEHEKQTQILEVLKNKKVNIIDLTCDIELSCCDNEALRFYNQNQTVENKLTKTEFDLIKEWLK